MEKVKITPTRTGTSTFEYTINKECHTVGMLLTTYLLKNEDVAFAAYVKTIDGLDIKVSTRNGKEAVGVVCTVLSDLSNLFTEMGTVFDGAIKKSK